MRALIIELAVLQTKAGKDYTNMKIRTADKQELPAKLWGVVDGLKAGVVINGDHKMDAYNGNPQVIFNNLGMDENQSMKDFEKCSEFEVNQMWSALVDFIECTSAGGLSRFVLEEMLNDDKMVEGLRRAPAAKGVHNAWFGGLLEHIISMCNEGVNLAQHYNRKYNVNISVDKVLFGCIFHDLGKIVEYNYKTASFDLAPTGLMVNHIVLGPAWIYHTVKSHAEFSKSQYEDEMYQLMHVCAAHHGKTEWGSPVAPVTLEAILVHHLDNLDAKMMHAIELIRGKEGPIKGFSEKSWCERVHYKQNKPINDTSLAEENPF